MPEECLTNVFPCLYLLYFSCAASLHTRVTIDATCTPHHQHFPNFRRHRLQVLESAGAVSPTWKDVFGETHSEQELQWKCRSQPIRSLLSHVKWSFSGQTFGSQMSLTLSRLDSWQYPRECGTCMGSTQIPLTIACSRHFTESSSSSSTCATLEAQLHHARTRGRAHVQIRNKVADIQSLSILLSMILLVYQRHNNPGSGLHGWMPFSHNQSSSRKPRCYCKECSYKYSFSPPPKSKHAVEVIHPQDHPSGGWRTKIKDKIPPPLPPAANARSRHGADDDGSSGDRS